jgi:hypothetical protein
MFVEKDELLVEDFHVEHRCDASNVVASLEDTVV